MRSSSVWRVARTATSAPAPRETGAVLHLTDEMVVVDQHYLLVGGYARPRPFKTADETNMWACRCWIFSGCG